MKKIFVAVFGIILVLSLVAAGQEYERVNSRNAPFIQDLNKVQAVQNLSERLRTQLKEGGYSLEDGKEVRIRTEANNRLRLEVNGEFAETNLNIEQQTTNNRTRMMVTLSNGRNAEIKTMPDTASKRALERLKLKNCQEENGCTMELKELKNQNQTRLAYELKAEKQARILGLFKTKMQVQAQINAENGEVLNIKKPWWAFLASESEE